MSAISWNESLVTSGSSASFGDDALRSLKTTIAIGLGQSFYWPGSAASQGASTASSGELQLGTLRFAKTGFQQGGFGDGFLSLDTTRISVRHIGSTWTGMVGHSGMLEASNAGVAITFPQTQRWLVQEGQYTSSGTTTNVNFPFAYARAPNVYLIEGYLDTLSANSQKSWFAYGVSSVTTGGFTSLESFLFGSATTGASYFWRAEGVATY